jgi:hypothetical protein
MGRVGDGTWAGERVAVGRGAKVGGTAVGTGGGSVGCEARKVATASVFTLARSAVGWAGMFGAQAARIPAIKIRNANFFIIYLLRTGQGALPILVLIDNYLNGRIAQYTKFKDLVREILRR